MDLMLNLISLTRKISGFVVQISLGRPYAEETVVIPQRHSRRKTDVKFVNNKTSCENSAFLLAESLLIGTVYLFIFIYKCYML